MSRIVAAYITAHGLFHRTNETTKVQVAADWLHIVFENTRSADFRLNALSIEYGQGRLSFSPSACDTIDEVFASLRIAQESRIHLARSLDATCIRLMNQFIEAGFAHYNRSLHARRTQPGKPITFWHEDLDLMETFDPVNALLTLWSSRPTTDYQA
ncbi:hypothetical protein [Halotalea alkalilenta]|uniref:Uncharacterized protein n=1 Tax=Halotalea alkalilenta TaxID=376489 RepID=A0A172YC88_9GAMM|nr:hypothetical protein [Halotalea alkalilenta]ANF56837.1 hypothetical protein A5892_04610 [Halotalea alkalilenta]